MKKITSMTVPNFFLTKASIGRREEIEKELACYICGNLIVTPLSTGQERLVLVGNTGYWAVCSEECFNMFVLQNI